jgi:tetratricopeptide (TPR) repeat protein
MIRVRSVRSVVALAAFAAGLLLSAPPAPAASSGGSGGGSDDEGGHAAAAETSREDEAVAAYERGMELVKESRYAEALERFRSAAKRDKKNPEYLNMVAYTQRKTGNLDDAFETYAKALQLKPKFPQAREYLGEAHLQAVLLQIDVLRGYGPDGRKELDALVAALQEAAQTLQAEPMGGVTPAPDKKGW